MRNIKQTLILSLLIFTFYNSFSQNEEKYKSKEEDAYYDSIMQTRDHEDFVPVSVEKAKYLTIIKKFNKLIV